MLNSLEQENPNRLELAGIIAQTSSEEDPENELDEGDPENCQLFKRGICKFQEQGFVEPKTVHWIGCEFPDCGKWWHEICLGIKFKAEEERNRYSFICPDHECDIAEIYPDQQKLKATTQDKSILENNDICAHIIWQENANSEKRRREQKYEVTRPDNYIEYKGQVYHIANFLSLQIGKAYIPTSGRLSRWISSSRYDFYDSIESITNTDNAILALGNFAAFFVPNVGLVVGKVIRIARTLKASTSFVVLKLDKESSKLPGVTEVAVLEYKGVEKGSRNLLPNSYTESKRYIWCNGRECVRVLKGEETNGKFQLTEDDQLFINSKLPELFEKESRRKKQEEKEKQEKIQQLKAGDPKDMTVILLREVLLEMGLSFKSSDSKQKLIDKVTHARSSLNITRDITRPVGAISNSASTMVRHTQQTSAQSQGINFARCDFGNYLRRATFSSNTYEQFNYKFIAYYVDFDLKKKIVLLVHLLFLSSMLITSSSAEVIAVMLATALLISTSLLAALEDLERVMAAARCLLMIIIIILNTTACVAVIEMVRFLSVYSHIEDHHFLSTPTVHPGVHE